MCMFYKKNLDFLQELNLQKACAFDHYACMTYIMIKHLKNIYIL